MPAPARMDPSPQKLSVYPSTVCNPQNCEAQKDGQLQTDRRLTLRLAIDPVAATTRPVAAPTPHPPETRAPRHERTDSSENCL